MKVAIRTKLGLRPTSKATQQRRAKIETLRPAGTGAPVSETLASMDAPQPGLLDPARHLAEIELAGKGVARFDLADSPGLDLGQGRSILTAAAPDHRHPGASDDRGP